MNERLNNIIKRLVSLSKIENTQGENDAQPLSTGERCYVALCANRYDLLPTSYEDPIEAWQRLDTDWRLAVCQWRGWPETYAIH